MKPVRVAVIGNGFARRCQLPAFRWAGGNEVIGIAGRDPEKLRATSEEWSIPVATTDWRELLALDPDLVVVTTPVHRHREMVLAALETRAAILCEKPFALNVAEAEEVAAAAEGRACWLDHQLRWSPYRRRVREMVGEGYLGEPWHGEFLLHFGSAEWMKRPYYWWFDAARGGGTLGATGSHMVDLVRSELGEVDAVRAELRTFTKRREDAHGETHECTADECAALWLRMANGALVSLTASISLPNGRGFQMQYTGSDGVIRLDGEESLSAAIHGDELSPIEVADDRPTFDEVGIENLGPFARSLPRYLRNMLEVVRAGGTSLPGAATFEDGLAVQRVLDAARQSSAGDGSWVACR